MTPTIILDIEDYFLFMNCSIFASMNHIINAIQSRTFVLMTFVGALLLISSSHAYADIHDIRKSFHQALLDAEYIEPFHDFMKTQSDTSPTVAAYKAISEALLAQKVWNPLEKFMHIQNFSEMMESCLANDSTNLEIRFLRFSVEYHIPQWLGFSKNINKDIDFINANSEFTKRLAFDSEYIRYIAYFIKHTNMFSTAELEVILNNLNSAMNDKEDR